MTDRERIAKLEGTLRQVRMHVREQAALQMTSMQTKEETRTNLEGISVMIDDVLAFSARHAIESECVSGEVKEERRSE